MRCYLTFGKEEAPEGFTALKPSQLSEQADGSVEEIQGPNVIEKIQDLVSFMEQVHRVLPTGGKAFFASGYYGCVNSYMSPLNVRALSEGSMNWCSKDWREQVKFTEIDTKIDFEVAVSFSTDASLNLRSDEVQHLWRTTRLNCVLGVQFTLTKR